MTLSDIRNSLKTSKENKKNFYAIPKKDIFGLMKDELTLIIKVETDAFLIQSISKNLIFRIKDNFVDDFKFIE